MIWTYIITWTIFSSIDIPCPCNYTVDEFGNKVMKSMQLAIACFEYKTDTMKKEFTNRDSAYAFMNKGITASKTFVFGKRSNTGDFKIDSIQVK